MSMWIDIFSVFMHLCDLLLVACEEYPVRLTRRKKIDPFFRKVDLPFSKSWIRPCI
jgi:hypothetical protein